MRDNTQQESVWSEVLTGLAVMIFHLVRIAPVTLIWVAGTLILEAILPNTWSFAVFGVLILAGAACFWLFPAATPLIADLRRFMQIRRLFVQRQQGYKVARQLHLVPPSEPSMSPFKRPGSHLPQSYFKIEHQAAVLESEQINLVSDGDLIRLATALAPALGYPEDHVSLERPSPGHVRIVWRRSADADPLEDLVKWPNADVEPGTLIPIGVREDGSTCLLSLFGSHLYIVAASGAGKSNLMWSAILPHASAIHAGSLVLIGVDLKGGVEFDLGRGLFSRVAYTYEDAAALIHHIVNAVLPPRLDYMRRNGLRLHRPTPEEPLMLVIIDEASSLSYLAPDSRSRNAVDADMKRLLSTARAAGIAVIAATQDPRKASLEFRDLFTQGITLRVRTKDDARLALGTAAYEAGAHADRIPANLPGIGYGLDSRTNEMVRFRTYQVDDETIRSVATRYPTPHHF